MAGGEHVELSKEVSTVGTKTWQWTDGGFKKSESQISQRAIVQRLFGTLYASFEIRHYNEYYWKEDMPPCLVPDCVDVLIPIRSIQFQEFSGNAVKRAVEKLDERIAELQDLRDGLASDPIGPLADLLTGGWDKIKASQS